MPVVAEGIAVQGLSILTFGHHQQRDLQLDVTLILKCLTQGENMTDCNNEKVNNLVQ